MVTVEMPKIEKRFEVLVRSNKSETDVYMYGHIGSYYGINAKEVKDELLRIKTDVINVHINSNGGDAFESTAIYNLLRQHSSTINIYVDGLAASGGSIIAMAGNKIYMPKNTMMMIHNAWTFIAGNAKELRKIADDLDKLDVAVTESYAGRFVGERSELKKLLDNETWLTADDCKALGFCDEVLELDNNGEEGVGRDTSDTDEILNKYIPGYAASADKKIKAAEAREERKKNNANMMYEFLLKLQKKEIDQK